MQGAGKSKVRGVIGVCFAAHADARTQVDTKEDEDAVSLLSETRSPPQGPENAGFLSRLCFLWVGPLLKTGRKQQLQQTDLFEVRCLCDNSRTELYGSCSAPTRLLLTDSQRATNALLTSSCDAAPLAPRSAATERLFQ